MHCVGRVSTDQPSPPAVERLFSPAGVTLSTWRNRLSDEIFDRMVLLKVLAMLRISLQWIVPRHTEQKHKHLFLSSFRSFECVPLYSEKYL